MKPKRAALIVLLCVIFVGLVIHHFSVPDFIAPHWTPVPQDVSIPNIVQSGCRQRNIRIATCWFASEPDPQNTIVATALVSSCCSTQVQAEEISNLSGSDGGKLCTTVKSSGWYLMQRVVGESTADEKGRVFVPFSQNGRAITFFDSGAPSRLAEGQ
jgi:hypothetical protein